jgi:hypothetical protein
MFTFKTDKLDPAGIPYKLFVPVTAAGANKVYFDLWNGSDKTLEVASVVPIASGAVAVVGTLAVDLFLTRTTAIGTGGTGATEEGTALNAATITKLDPDAPPLRAGITARFTPAGGATAGAVIGFNSQFTEETALPTYFRSNLVEGAQPGLNTVLTVRPGTGIRVVQGAVASVGNIGFDVLFQVMDN